MGFQREGGETEERRSVVCLASVASTRLMIAGAARALHSRVLRAAGPLTSVAARRCGLPLSVPARSLACYPTHDLLLKKDIKKGEGKPRARPDTGERKPRAGPDTGEGSDEDDGEQQSEFTRKANRVASEAREV